MLVPIGESVATLLCNGDLTRVKAREGMFQLRLWRRISRASGFRQSALRASMATA